MTPIIASVALLFVAALPQSTPTPASATTIFHSDVLHFDYTYDSGFTAQPSVADEAVQSEKDKATGVMKAAISCVSLPLTAIDANNGFRMIMILRMDSACMGQKTTATQLGPLVTSTLTQSLTRFGAPQVSASADYAVAGHPAAAIAGSVKSDKYGATFYATASCLIQGADAVCWEFLASDCSKLPQLIANPVHFDGQSPAALIPDKFAQTCKP
jgi:hypothetical protein